MVNGQLIQALDWRKKKGEAHGRYSYRRGEVWYVVHHGPGFSNTFRVTDHDDAGLASLLKIERKEGSDAQDQTV